MADSEGNVEGTPSAASSGADDVNALRAELEQIKKAQAGSDRAYQEAAKKAAALEAEKEALIKERMTEKEKAEYEFKRQREELEAKSREVAEATLHLLKSKLMAEKGIKPAAMQFIAGTNETEILQSIDTFNKQIEEMVTERVNSKLISAPPPKAGASSPGVPDYSNLSTKQMERMAAEGTLSIRS